MLGNTSASKRSSNTMCCVIGCTNRYSNTPNEVKFYSFPGRPHEAQLRTRWISAVNRKNHDNTPWHPPPRARICSKHFVGNAKSGDPSSPAYVPSIFPTTPEEKINILEISLKRHERIKKRRLIQAQEFNKVLKVENSKDDSAVHVSPENSKSILTIKAMEPLLPTKEVKRQEHKSVLAFDARNEQQNGAIFEFSCTFDRENNICHASTQANISRHSLINSCHVMKKDKKCGPNHPHTERGFCDFNSVKDSPEKFQKLTGNRNEIFDLFLGMLPDMCSSKVDKRNRLFIFFMKMKTGMSYDGLSVMFNVHPTTVSRIFKDVLSNLSKSTKHCLEWPSRQVIQDTMSDVFKAHYPKCRVIIDFVEIKTEQPSSAEQRVQMYSSSKSTCTVKFLIGFAPHGAVIFISKQYGGSTSDSHIMNDSGLLELLETGDEVLVDKNCLEIINNFKDKEKNQFTALPALSHKNNSTEEEISKAGVRIHVDKCLHRIKKYDILNKLSTELLPNAENIMQLCCVMANLHLMNSKE